VEGVPIKSYGASYKKNKNAVWRAIKSAHGLSAAQKLMLFSIGMLETNTFSAAQRDRSKDGTPSQNWSLFNANTDMLVRARVASSARGLGFMNSAGQIKRTVAAMAKAIKKYGSTGFLNYMRGGYQGWKDHHSYDCAGYRRGVAKIASIVNKDKKLLTDDRRVDLVVAHQG
jgi:hypothetical protein